MKPLLKRWFWELNPLKGLTPKTKRGKGLELWEMSNQEKVGVECFRRNPEGLWVLYPYTQGQEVELASVNFKCAIGSIYEDVMGIG